MIVRFPQILFVTTTSTIWENVPRIPRQISISPRNSFAHSNPAMNPPETTITNFGTMLSSSRELGLIGHGHSSTEKPGKPILHVQLRLRSIKREARKANDLSDDFRCGGKRKSHGFRCTSALIFGGTVQIKYARQWTFEQLKWLDNCIADSGITVNRILAAFADAAEPIVTCNREEEGNKPFKYTARCCFEVGAFLKELQIEQMLYCKTAIINF